MRRFIDARETNLDDHPFGESPARDMNAGINNSEEERRQDVKTVLTYLVEGMTSEEDFARGWEDSSDTYATLCHPPPCEPSWPGPSLEGDRMPVLAHSISPSKARPSTPTPP